MLDLRVKYGFLSTFDETIFVRQARQGNFDKCSPSRTTRPEPLWVKLCTTLNSRISNLETGPCFA